MVSKILISSSIKVRLEEIARVLSQAGLKNPHPDLLYFTADSKLGISEARKIKEHLSFKPFQARGRVVVVEDTSNLTPDAQNALLKTLEEPPPEAVIILAAASDNVFLPTILSRCEVTNLSISYYDTLENHSKYTSDITKLVNSTLEERFSFIGKLKDRAEFLRALASYFHQQLQSSSTHARPGLARLNANFLQELLQAEQWAKQNVNIRAILEYLMLIMPKK